METHNNSFTNLLTISILLLSISATTASSSPLPSPPSSISLASETLRTRGYSLFASLLLSHSQTTTNFSGTILAPPDLAFSFATAKFLNRHRPPPHPSVSLLLYHTLPPPFLLAWPSRASQYRTFHQNNCLFLSENSVSSSPYQNPISTVKIRYPELYVDENLTVHGIDGVLDPTFATKCFKFDPNVEKTPRFIDHAIRKLRRSGFSLVATGMSSLKSELLSLTSVTIFAVSDENLFRKPGGFRYDFRHHVVPVRHRFKDIAKVKELETLDKKKVSVNSVNGVVRVDGVEVDRVEEVYRNRWIVVVSIVSSLDDVVMVNEFTDYDGVANTVLDGDDDFPSLAPEGSVSPALSPAVEDGCDMNDVVSIGVEGGDLFCSVSNNRREVLELENSSGVDESKSLDGRDDSRVSEELTGFDQVKIEKNVNIADDLFFYT